MHGISKQVPSISEPKKKIFSSIREFFGDFKKYNMLRAFKSGLIAAFIIGIVAYFLQISLIYIVLLNAAVVLGLFGLFSTFAKFRICCETNAESVEKTVDEAMETYKKGHTSESTSLDLSKDHKRKPSFAATMFSYFVGFGLSVALSCCVVLILKSVGVIGAPLFSAMSITFGVGVAVACVVGFVVALIYNFFSDRCCSSDTLTQEKEIKTELHSQSQPKQDNVDFSSGPIRQDDRKNVSSIYPMLSELTVEDSSKIEANLGLQGSRGFVASHR